MIETRQAMEELARRGGVTKRNHDEGLVGHYKRMGVSIETLGTFKKSLPMLESRTGRWKAGSVASSRGTLITPPDNVFVDNTTIICIIPSVGKPVKLKK
jgi:hypothetical protein